MRRASGFQGIAMLPLPEEHAEARGGIFGAGGLSALAGPADAEPPESCSSSSSSLCSLSLSWRPLPWASASGLLLVRFSKDLTPGDKGFQHKLRVSSASTSFVSRYEGPPPKNRMLLATTTAE